MTKRLLDYGGKTPYDYTDENKTESFNWHHKLKKKMQENIFVTLTWEPICIKENPETENPKSKIDVLL